MQSDISLGPLIFCGEKEVIQRSKCVSAVQWLALTPYTVCTVCGQFSTVFRQYTFILGVSHVLLRIYRRHTTAVWNKENICKTYFLLSSFHPLSYSFICNQKVTAFFWVNGVIEIYCPYGIYSSLVLLKVVKTMQKI